MGLMKFFLKFFHPSNPLMLDKSNFTSNLSLESSFVLQNIPSSLFPIKSALKNVTLDGFSSFGKNKTRSRIIATKLPTEVPVETRLDREILLNGCNEYISNTKRNYLPDEIEKPGLYAIQSSHKFERFCGVIYLPECYVILAHYLTLYRLKLDALGQYDFENWCLTVGHTETARRYLQLQKVYSHLKKNHFNEAFIINQIVAKQNVHLRITDSFGDSAKPLRAFVFVGKCRSIVKSVVDCYCFNVRGKIPFIIKSTDDYRNLLQSNDKSRITHYKVQDSDLNCHDDWMSDTPMNIPRIVRDSTSNVIEVLNIHPNSVNDLRYINNGNQADINIDIYPNYMRYQGYRADISSICFNSPILCNGITYNLVSIIGDKKYAYVLCKNEFTNYNYYVENDFHSIMSDESSENDNECNSDSHYILRDIMRKEICEAFTDKFYGISLKDVPCGLFYVVQCTLDGYICETDSLLNDILIRHLVCGKVISKEYNFELQDCGVLNFIMHLHGNEGHVLNCSNELKIEGLARNFKLIHPQSANSIQESVKTENKISS